MNKRGSHVEVIISFIIFVTFMLFVFSILSPSLTTQKDKENLFDNVELKIIDKVSSNMTIITVNLNGEGGTCVNLNNLIINFGIGENIIVKDSLGETVESYADGSSLQINKGSTSETLFKIYYSEEFDELGTDSGCTEIGYDLGLTKTREYIFEKKFIDLINEDYETLADEIDLPEGMEIGYGIILSNGTTFETNEGKSSTNFYVRETPIKYIDSEGNILAGYIKTKNMVMGFF